MGKKISEIKIYYNKTSSFQSYFVDGAVGGNTPTGMVNLNFFSTRLPMPKHVTHDLYDDGKLSKNGVNSSDSKDGIIREVEVGIYLSKESAEELVQFLTQILDKTNGKKS